MEVVNRFRRGNKIRPSESLDESRSTKVEIDSGFRIIFTFGLILGLPHPFLLTMRRPKITEMVAKILLEAWIVLLTVVKTFLFCMDCIYLPLFWSSFATQVCHSIHCVCGFVTVWVFILKRNEIRRLIEKISYFHSVFNFHERGYKGARTLLYLFMTLLCAEGFLLIQSQYFFGSDWDSLVQRVKIYVPFKDDSKYYLPYCALVFISFIFTYDIGTVTFLVALFFCGMVYRSLSQLFAMYGNKLRKGIQRNHFTAETAIKDIRLFNDINRTVDEMNQVFRVFTLVFYTEIFVIFFGSVSTTLSADILLRRTILVLAFVVLVVIVGNFLLFHLHYSGETIHVESEKLKKELIGISASLMSQSPDTRTLVMFNLLSRQINEAHIRATAMDVYDVTARFIPEIVGALISYGVLLHQMGGNS